MPTPTLSLHACQVSLDSGAVQRRDGRAARLTRLERSLLGHLHAHRDQTVEREVLYRDVWGHSCRLNTRTLDMTISRVRGKIEQDPHRPRNLLTSPGRGYRLVGTTDVAWTGGAGALSRATQGNDTCARLWLEHATRAARQARWSEVQEALREARSWTDGSTTVRPWEVVAYGHVMSACAGDLTSAARGLGALGDRVSSPLGRVLSWAVAVLRDRARPGVDLDAWSTVEAAGADAALARSAFELCLFHLVEPTLRAEVPVTPGWARATPV